MNTLPTEYTDFTFEKLMDDLDSYLSGMDCENSTTFAAARPLRPVFHGNYTLLYFILSTLFECVLKENTRNTIKFDISQGESSEIPRLDLFIQINTMEDTFSVLADGSKASKEEAFDRRLASMGTFLRKVCETMNGGIVVYKVADMILVKMHFSCG